MSYVFIGLIILGSIGLAAYSLIQRSELVARVAVLEEAIVDQDSTYSNELEALRSDIVKLDKYKHIPNIIEKSRKVEAETQAKLDKAEKEAGEIVLAAYNQRDQMQLRIAASDQEAQKKALQLIHAATTEAQQIKNRIISETQYDSTKAKEARSVAELQAVHLIDEAHLKAKEIAAQARKEGKEKTKLVEETLKRATTYALEIRNIAETKAQEVGGRAYEALRRYEFYEATANAMQNVVSGYGNTYMIPASHLIDELADDYGFHKSGEKLKLARERTRIMEKNGVAATCNYPEGWKREYAISFVLSAFNGKVDSILSRLKPANQGKLIQEIKDVYALANHNGEVFKNARIHEEYLDARLEELKWAVAVQRLKEREREEQRAIREQMREEEKARRDYEKAIKQSAREEDLLMQALEKARLEYNAASLDDRARYEAKFQTLTEQLKEAEEKNRRAISMAQQTKCGHVYVISNIGSFGENVYKIGLTRRLEPTDRIRELGGASVPFNFDVHAMIYSEDAPALETSLHRRFLQCQVNKVNRRKEFFRLSLQEIRNVIGEMRQEVKWTIAAEAKDYRETLSVERRLLEDPAYRERWQESEAAYESRLPFDDEGDEAELEDEETVLAEEVR